MAIEIDTAADHVDLFDRLMAFLQIGITTPGGPDWTLLRYDSDNQRALFHAPGLTGLEDIYVGISVHESVDTDAYALGFWMFRSYNEALDDLQQPGHSGVGYLPVWNQATPYWFIANGQRLMIVAKISTVYSATYIGKFLPYGVPGEYPQPYYIGNSVTASTTRWSTVEEAQRNFWDPGSGGKILLPSGQWRTVQNFRDLGGESSLNNSNYTWPFQAYGLHTSTLTEYRRMRENVDGTYPLWPITLMGSNPDDDIFGELDGAFAVSGFNNASENTVTIDGASHLIVQNLFRTARYYYAALKLE